MTDELKILLSKLVSFDTSINPEKGLFPSAECRNYLMEYARNHNFEVYALEGDHRGNAVYPLILVKRGKKSGKTVLFLGHIDVVPVSKEELKHWDTDPFEPEVIDGFLMGRGSSDMKGGVAAFLIAFKDFEPEKGNLVIAISGDEEIGGIGSLPPMINKLKEIGLLPDFVLNAEPSKDRILVTRRRGATWLSFQFPIKEERIRGRIETKDFFSVQGDGSQTLHSAFFLFGADVHAMIAAAKFSVDKKIRSLTSSSTKSNAVPYKVTIEYVVPDETYEEVTYSPSLSKVLANLASIGSLDWPIKHSKYGISVNPNVFSMENNVATLIFDIRAMFEDETSHEEILQMLTLHLGHGGVPIKGEILSAINPVDVSPDSYLPRTVANVCAKYDYPITAIGEKLGGASDTRFFTELGIPGVELGPIGKNEHGTNEGVNLASLELLVTIFRETYRTLQNGVSEK
ncbi:MAG: M20/M25/M40 family metallo-hydrolase [Methanobacteriota archaeon]|nr:MAG: M20/M25/M40 family metallo-hydrolase [Euryarchaeota archaeon]